MGDGDTPTTRVRTTSVEGASKSCSCREGGGVRERVREVKISLLFSWEVYFLRPLGCRGIRRKALQERDINILKTRFRLREVRRVGRKEAWFPSWLTEPRDLPSLVESVGLEREVCVCACVYVCVCKFSGPVERSNDVLWSHLST